MESHFATLGEAIADTIGDREALVTGETRRTWTEFDDRASRLAAAFADAGLRPDSSVAQAEFMSARVPSAEMRVLEGYGHICLINHDLDLLDFAGPWWARVAPGGAG